MYSDRISKATGVTDKVDLEYIEDAMRHVIFHSTLDWQDSRTFNKGAKEAWAMIKEARSLPEYASLYPVGGRK